MVAQPPAYPVQFDVQYPERLSRWLIFVKGLLAIPHIVVLMFLYVAALLAWFVACFVILFTCRFPRGLFRFLTGVLRWTYRVNAYINFLRDEYPPFSLG